MNNDYIISHLKRYIKCVDGFFKKLETSHDEDDIKYEGLFYEDKLKGLEPLAISENYKMFLKFFILTRPLYIAKLMSKAIKKYDANTLLEVVCTQKFKDLELAIKIMKLLYFTSELDFKQFSYEQKKFDQEMLYQLLNWRFYPQHYLKPIISLVIY